MPKLTETFAKKLPFVESGTQKHWDTEVKGFVLFVGKRSKSWYFQKDVGGKTKRALIGRYPTISAAAARQTAQEMLLDMSRGAGKTVQKSAPTFGEALDTYLTRPKLRSEAHKIGSRQMAQRHLSDWLKLSLENITKAMVVARHRDLAKTPSAANHALRLFRAVWNHARRVHDLPESPTLAIEFYEERPEGQVIEDLSAWRREIDDVFNPIHRAFYELALFTGFRKTELLTLEWKNVLDDRIHLPVTKNGRSFDLPINDRHLAIMKPLKKLSRTWVFPSPKSPNGHVGAPERISWNPHAHRRTFATVAMEAGVLEEIVGRLLNHTPISITGRRYVRPSLDSLRPAMDQICVELDRRIVGGRE